MKFNVAFFLLIFVSFSFVTSCRSNRQVVQKSDTKTDSVKSDVVTYRDTIFITNPAETTIKLPFKDQLNAKPRTYSQTNGNATVKVRVERDTLRITALCDSLKINAKIRERHTQQLNTIEQNYNEQIKETRGYSLFELIIYTLAAFCIGLGVGVLLKTLKLI